MASFELSKVLFHFQNQPINHFIIIQNVWQQELTMNCIRIVLQNLRDLILRFDLFAATPTFRVRGQSSYETLGCGMLSIIMIATFAGIFAGQIIDVLNKADVQASINLDDEPQSTEVISDIHFALGIQQVKFTDINGYFDISVKLQNFGNEQRTQTQIELVSCTKDIWSSYSQQIEQYYQPMKVEEMLCIPPNQNLTIFGYEGSTEFNTFKIEVSKCVDKVQCKNNTNIDFFFRQIGYIPVRLLFINKVISPTNEVPVTTTVEKNIFLSFSGVLGSRGQIILGKYLVQTDESIWPFSTIINQTGHYIQDFRTYTVGIEPTGADFDPKGSRNQNYIDLFIRKSTLIYKVSRKHDKIDDLLSYIGGLFSLIFFVFFWFFGSFNQYRLELLVAEASFSYDKEGKKVREKDLGYFTYFLYSLYDWLKMIGINLNWKKMKKIDEARQEANQQLDVAYLMRKIRYYDWCFSLLMDSSHRITSHLIKPVTLQESIKQRKLHEYYDKVIRNKFTDDQFEKAKQILQTNIRIKQLPIEHYRKMKSGKIAEDKNQSLGQIIGKTNSVIKQTDINLEIEDQKENKKSCNCSCTDLIQDRYDSDDEQAEQIIFEHYQKLIADSSSNAFQIKDRIPYYFKNRMLKRLSKDDDQQLANQRQAFFIQI